LAAALRRARAGKACCRRSERAGAAKQDHPEDVFVASPGQVTKWTSFAFRGSTVSPLAQVAIRDQSIHNNLAELDFGWEINDK
jgi:hypothetical protein